MRHSREQRFGSESEVIAEVARTLRDVERYAVTARHIQDADRLASIDVARRSIEGLKLLGVEGPSGVAGHFMSWLMARAAVLWPTDPLAAAIAAAEGSRRDDPLRVELVAFVRGYLAGEISDEESTRRWKRALAATDRALVPEAGEKPEAVVGATTVAQAEKRLRQMLSDAGLDLERLDPASTWRTFKAFAAEPIHGSGTSADDDLCLFECGVRERADGGASRFEWGLWRQFSVYDADGAYDHMVQLCCALFFEVTPQIEQLRETAIWSGSDLAAWAADVEAQAGFKAATGIAPIESRVEQSRV